MITQRLISTTLTRLGAIVLLALGLSLLGGRATLAAPVIPPAPAYPPGPSAPTAAPADTQDFEDVPVSAPYYTFLHNIYTQGIVSGYTCGGPGEPCGAGSLPYYRAGSYVTRSQMSKFVDLARTQPGAAFEAGTSGVIPVFAHTTSGNAFVGISNNGDGIYAYSSAGTGDGGAVAGQGVHNYGVYATSSYSDALHVEGPAYVSGDSILHGKAYIGGFTIINEYGSPGPTQSLLVVGSGYLDGDLTVTGTCCGAENLTTQIVDPRDPDHKTLNQAAVVASEQLAVYSGNVTTDQAGFATVTLPAYVPATNGDFRYQLTPIGQFAQAIVSQEVTNNHFTIQTDKPNVKVSWQVTGVRTDSAAVQHPLVVEQAKTKAPTGK